MKVYYLQAEYETGKHKIVDSWAEISGLNTPDAGITEAYSVLEFDEFYNRKLAKFLFLNSRILEELPDRFYISAGQIVNNDTDEVIIINPNPQRESYKLSQLYGLTQAQLEAYIENNVTNLVQAKAFLKKLSAVVLWLVKQSRLDE